MMSIDDIPDLLDELKTGTFSLGDVVSLCLDLFERNDVDAVLTALPDEVRAYVIADITATFDNDIPVGDFMIFDSARGDHPAKALIIDRVRRWLKAHGGPGVQAAGADRTSDGRKP
jgi:hypothetical protein